MEKNKSKLKQAYHEEREDFLKILFALFARLAIQNFDSKEHRWSLIFYLR